MSRFFSWLGSLAAELKRRRIYHVASVYAVVAWVILQVAKILVDALFLPPASLTAILVLALLGFPFAMVVTWIYDLTPEGMERTAAAEGDDAPPPGVRRGVLAVLMAATLVATAGAGWATWRVWLGPSAAVGSNPAGLSDDSAPPALDPNRIAVLYFDNLSGDPSLDAVAGGLTEDLTHELAQVETLDVVSRNAVKPYRSGDVSLDSIARDLKAGTLVEGSVGRDGDRLEVTTQLVDASRESHITSERVQRAGEDLLGLRRQIVDEVARAIRRHLGHEIELRETRSRTDDAGAWRLYHEAREMADMAHDAARRDDTASARLMYRQADSVLARSEERDPEWLDPVVERAWVAEGLARSSSLSLRDMETGALQTGIGHADRALSMEAGSAAALEVRGVLLGRLSDVVESPDSAHVLEEAAEEHLRSAVAADPERARAWAMLAVLLMDQGRLPEAELAARRSRQADPYLENDALNPFVSARLALETRQLDVALELTRRSRFLFPDEPAYPALQLLVLAGHDAPVASPDTAWTLVSEVAGPDPERRWPTGLPLVAAVLARNGLPDSARSVLARGESAAPDHPLTHYYGANVHVLLGEEPQALEHLATYLEALPHQKEYVAQDWWWEPLRDEPGFVALVKSDG